MDAGGNEPEREYEEYPCHWIELGLGAANILVPRHWTIRDRDINGVTFEIAEISGATFSAELTCYEDPEAIGSNDLAHYLNHPAAPPFSEDSLDKVRDESGRPDFEELTVHFGCTEGGKAGDPNVTAEVDIWRRLYLLQPDYIRVVEFYFDTPVGAGVDDDYRRSIASSLRALIAETTCLDTPTPFDRVAPTRGLKLSPLWDCIYIRVPEAWERERENPDGDGMYVFDDKENDRWTLWVDYNSYAADDKAGIDADEIAQGLASSLREHRETDRVDFVPLPDQPGEAMLC